MSRSVLLGYMLLGALALIWGSSFILIKKALIIYQGLEIGALRTFIAGIVLLPFAWQSWRKLSPKARGWVALIIGLCSSAIPAILFGLAQQRITSATSGILNALTPLFVLIIGRAFFQERLSLLQIVGVIVGLLGTGFLLLTQEFSLEWYALFAVGATVCYGINVNVIHHYAKDENPLALASVSMVFMLPLTGGVLLQTGFLNHFTEQPALAWEAFWYVSILGILGTAFAFLVFNYIIRIYGGLFGSLVTYLIPIVAIGWGLWDRESVTNTQIMGVVTILLSIYLVKYRSPRSN